MKRSSLILLVLAGLTGCALLVWFLYIQPIFIAGNVQWPDEEKYFTIPTGTTFQQLLNQLEKEDILADTASFRRCAAYLHYGDQVKPGKYLLQDNWSNLTFIRLLRSGAQSPIKLVIHNVRTLDELAGKIGQQLELDSTDMTDALSMSRSLVPEATPGEDSLLCLFLPNTYEVYWTITAQELLERMWKEYNRFWTEARKSLAQQTGFTPNQIYILASIVEKETLASAEKSIIAGVYLNRLHQGIPLQADPTVVFAKGDFTTGRVLFKDLEIDSPYNTYIYSGLPPGPICIPEPSTIDATLKAENHDYIYFCAKPDQSGRHTFAKTLAAHNENARVYQNWLNQNRIFR